MENVGIKVDVKLLSKKNYLKLTSKPNYISHKIFDNDLVVIHKNKVTLTHNKHSNIGMCSINV